MRGQEMGLLLSMTDWWDLKRVGMEGDAWTGDGITAIDD